MKDEIRVAYDEVSPITGNFCVIVEDDPEYSIINKLCMESGFITNNMLIDGTESQKNFDAQATTLMRALKVIDANGSVWYPLSMTIGPVVFYTAGTTSSWQWVISKMIELDSEDQEKYKVPGADDQYYKWHLDIENSEVFDSNKFSDAFDRFHEVLRDESRKLHNNE